MIYFLTVNYYSAALIGQLIASISDNINSPYQVLIINNSPNEAEIHQLKSDCVDVIESGKNIGFGAACNLGIEQVYQMDSTALVWLINPDAVLDKQADVYVQSCLADHPSLAILGTQIRNTNGEIWFASGKFNPWTGYVNHGAAVESESNHLPDICPTDWVSGCSLIINLSCFSEPPTFDPSYFLYLEDADFCVRYTLQGYSIAITKAALVTHQVSAIIGKNTKFMFHHYTYGRLLFLRRHATLLGFGFYLAYLPVKILSLVFTDQENAKGRWLGIQDFFRGDLPGELSNAL